MITGLSFEEDHSKQKLPDGTALIKAARSVQPDLKILVFSADGRPAVIETLFGKYGIDGHVRKARNDARELKTAIGLIDNQQRHFPRHLKQLVAQKNAHEFTEYDVTILTLMVQGLR